jgi:hypothetical protein
MKIFFCRIRYAFVSLMAGITGNKKIIRYKILAGTMILGLMVMPACHTKKKTMCYYFMLPDPQGNEVSAQKPGDAGAPTATATKSHRSVCP